MVATAGAEVLDWRLDEGTSADDELTELPYPLGVGAADEVVELAPLADIPL